MAEIMRNQIADYLNVGSVNAPAWALMGVGFNTLDENPAAQTKSVVYINDAAETSSIKSYKPAFPFDTDLISDEAAIEKLYDIGRNEKTGANAQVEYVRVELFKDGSGANLYKARKFTVSVEVASLAGKGGETVKVTGNLNNVGSFVDGEFNTVTKEFVPYAGALAEIVISAEAGAVDKCKVSIYPFSAGEGYAFVYKSAADVPLPVFDADIAAWTPCANGDELAGLTVGHELVVAKREVATGKCKGVSNIALVVLGA